MTTHHNLLFLVLHSTKKTEFMYVISKELEIKGFSIISIDDLITRNNGSSNFNTMEYFVIFIVFEKTKIIVDGRPYFIEDNNLVYIAPYKNVIYEFGDSQNTIVAFSSSFYEKSAKDSFILNSELFFNDLQDIFICPAIGNSQALKGLIIERINLYKEKDFGIYIAVAHNCVEILLLDGLLRLEESSFDKINHHSTYLDKVNKFRVLLQKNFKKEKSVSFYSEQLNVSPQRLSVMTKTVLGKGAKKIVVDKVAGEAKKMLENSTLNISEIAFELGFLDEANFSTFVKKNLGKSPTEMREFLLNSAKNTN